ncbi:MAG: hypothetical protein OXF11_08690 [Deltaproteobacteria bacterium]|nr:hypothetical protein [Deltaproteobacteria bacterium]
MSRWRLNILLCFVFCAAALPGWSFAEETTVRFAALDVHLETAEPVAAWQFELSEAGGRMRVVGVENGDSPAFPKAPYYDRKAVNDGRADRIIVADFTLRPGNELPVGRVRIATVHVRLTGDSGPDYVLRLVTAGNAEGKPVPAAIHLDIQSGRKRK